MRGLTFLLAVLVTAPLGAQGPALQGWPWPGWSFTFGPKEVPVDTIMPPVATKPVVTRRDALLPGHRIVAFYGTPLSTRMGVLGAMPPEQMFDSLEAVSAQWQAADSSRKVLPALHLIVTVAQPLPGGDGMYRLRHGDAVIGKVAAWAEEHDWLMFLDLQIGRSTVAAELERLKPWLALPYVHLAIDPEFAMPADGIPGRRIGSIDAAQINDAITAMADIVQRHRLPPKVLVVHRFTERMLTNEDSIIADPRVQVVIHMDGFGSPALKHNIYRLVVTNRPVQFAGLKLFTRNDKPIMTPTEVVNMVPISLYIQYQ